MIRWPVRAIPIAHCKLQIFKFLPSKSHISPFKFPPFIFLPLKFHIEFPTSKFHISPFEFPTFSLPYKISLLNLRYYIMGNSTELILIACLESCLKMLPQSSPAQLCGIQREQLIHYHFLEGHTYRLILCFLLLVHRIPLSLQQLKRVLCKLGLKRRVTIDIVSVIYNKWKN